MSGIFRTIFGGPSKSKEQAQNSSTSFSGNYAYPAISGSLAPATNYVSAGGNMLGALLGIPGYGGTPSAPASPAPAPKTMSVAQAPTVGGGSAGPMPNNPLYSDYTDGNQGFRDYTGRLDTSDISGRGNDGSYGGLSRLLGRNAPQAYNVQPTQPDQVTGITPGPAADAHPLDALNNWANSAGMQFIRDQGVKAIDGSMAGKGMLQSGATGKALTEYGQNLAQTYLDKYMQQVLGFANLGNDAAKNLAIAGDYSQGKSSGTSSGKSEGAKEGALSKIAKFVAAAG